MAEQNSEEFLKTQSTITSVESKVSGKRPRTIVHVQYVIESGDTINGQLQLTGMPFLGSSKKVGDTLTILYQKDNPYRIQTKSQSFFESYGLYLLIVLGLIFIVYRFLKRKNGA